MTLSEALKTKIGVKLFKMEIPKLGPKWVCRDDFIIKGVHNKETTETLNAILENEVLEFGPDTGYLDGLIVP